MSEIKQRLLPGIKTKSNNLLSLRDTSKPQYKWAVNQGLIKDLHVFANSKKWRLLLWKWYMINT